MTDLQLKCECGAFEGVLHDATPDNGVHAACYCKDCQAFAAYLGKQDDALDKNGGTRIYQTLPSHLDIIKGAENLNCVRLSPKGLMRWHVRCCNSPIGNTPPGRGLSFVGLITNSLHNKNDGQTVDDAIGPLQTAGFTQHAYGDIDPSIPSAGFKMIFAALKRALGARLSGAYKQTPFFDADNSPVAEPKTLSDNERTALYNKIGQAT